MTPNTLAERLRGIIRVPVNDGAGLLDGKDFFERSFPTSNLAREAADRIEALEAQIAEDTIRLAEDTDAMEEATTRIKTQRARIEALEKINIDWAKGNLAHVKECHKYQDRIAALEAALRFYADPFAWKEQHDPEDIVQIPDFYSETSFGDTALAALAPEQDK